MSYPGSAFFVVPGLEALAGPGLQSAGELEGETNRLIVIKEVMEDLESVCGLGERLGEKYLV